MSDEVVFPEGPSQSAKRRLRIAQQAYRAADALARVNWSDADRVVSVVQFYFAIETVLRAALFDAKHSKARAESFRELLNAVEGVLSEGREIRRVPGRGGLEQVQSVRKAAQHEARVPTLTEVTECAVHARDGLIDLTRLLWDTDFLASEIDAVQSERVRDYLHRAANANANGDLRDAMGWLRTAFEYAFKHGGENIIGPVVDLREIMVRTIASPHDRPDPFRKGEEAAVAFKRLQVFGRLTAFSMNVPEYLHWRNKFSGLPAEWTSDDFDAGLAYVVDSILKMEQIVGDVDPGGFTRGGFDKL